MGLLDPREWLTKQPQNTPEWNPMALGASILANNMRPNFGNVMGNAMGDYTRIRALQNAQGMRQEGLDAEKQKREAMEAWANQHYPGMPVQMAVEQWKVDNRAAPKPGAPVAVDDPNSPTGRSFRTPAEAVGKNAPGKSPLVSNVIEAERRASTPEAIAHEDRMYDAKNARDVAKGWRTAAFAAPGNIRRYDQAIKLLDTVETGTFEDIELQGRKIAAAFGFEVDWANIADAEQLQTLLGDEVMSRVQETKGAVSEKEMDLFEKYSANYGNTPEGNRQILKFKRAQAERDIEIQKYVTKLRKEGKSYMEVQDAVMGYMLENPLDYLLADVPTSSAGPMSLEDAAAAEIQRRQGAR